MRTSSGSSRSPSATSRCPSPTGARGQADRPGVDVEAVVLGQQQPGLRRREQGLEAGDDRGGVAGQAPAGLGDRGIALAGLALELDPRARLVGLRGVVLEHLQHRRRVLHEARGRQAPATRCDGRTRPGGGRAGSRRPARRAGPRARRAGRAPAGTRARRRPRASAARDGSGATGRSRPRTSASGFPAGGGRRRTSSPPKRSRWRSAKSLTATYAAKTISKWSSHRRSMCSQ